MKYIQAEAALREKGWLYCGAGIWRNGTMRRDLVEAYYTQFRRYP